MLADLPGVLHADGHGRRLRILAGALLVAGAVFLAWLVAWIVA